MTTTNDAQRPASSPRELSPPAPSAFWTAAGAALGFLAVALGAFGAHGLEELLARLGREATYQTAALYHLVHAPAIFALGLRGTPAARRGAAALALGIAIFSGSLYALAVTDARWLGAITPFGGTAFLVGWGMLAWSGWRRTL